jgi:hypothetical protein
MNGKHPNRPPAAHSTGELVVTAPRKFYGDVNTRQRTATFSSASAASLLLRQELLGPCLARGAIRLVCAGQFRQKKPPHAEAFERCDRGLSVAPRSEAHALHAGMLRSEAFWAWPLALPARGGTERLPFAGWRELGAARVLPWLRHESSCLSSERPRGRHGRTGYSCTHRSRRHRLISAAANQQRRQPAAPLSDCIRSLRTQPHACAAAPTSREALRFRCFLHCQLVCAGQFRQKKPPRFGICAEAFLSRRLLVLRDQVMQGL